MRREEATYLVVADELSRMGSAQREALLLDWWSIDEDDEEFVRLPELPRKELEQSDGPTGDPVAEKYLPLVAIAVRSQLVGVTNLWLSSRVTSIQGNLVEVQGPAVVLEQCPCCGYRTLTERGTYSICRVCFWEDDGNDDECHYSDPNGMKLVEGRANVAKFGVVAERFRGDVPMDAMERYEYGGVRISRAVPT